MEGTIGTTSDFIAGVNQPAGPPTAYLWTPLIILGAGLAILAVALVRLARTERRELPPSFFDN
jgi:hypothetical protein